MHYVLVFTWSDPIVTMRLEAWQKNKTNYTFCQVFVRYIFFHQDVTLLMNSILIDKNWKSEKSNLKTQ